MAKRDRHAVMTLYSDPECLLCHRVRFVAQEKNIPLLIENSIDKPWPEEVAAANPYGNSPTLVNRDLILFNSDIIIDYFNDRFLQPMLLPSDPEGRARTKLLLHRIDQEWYPLWQTLSESSKQKSNQARKTLIEDLTVLSPVFEQHRFFMNDEFSILDCYLAPLLWRLFSLSIKLPSKAWAVEQYAERIFARPAFQASLSNIELTMR